MRGSLALAVLSLMLAGSVAGQTSTPTPPVHDLLGMMKVYSLRSLLKVSVEVQSGRASSDIQKWVESTRLKERIEASLQKGGLAVVNVNEWAAADARIPLFQIVIYARQHASGHSYAINVFLQEGVSLDREKRNWVLGATWTATNWGYLASVADWSKITDDADRAVALFLHDWQKAKHGDFDNGTLR